MTTRTTIEKGPDGKKVKTIETVDTAQQNSIEITKNAKGEKATKIKVYDDDVQSMDTKLEAYEIVAEKHGPTTIKADK